MRTVPLLRLSLFLNKNISSFTKPLLVASLIGLFFAFSATPLFAQSLGMGSTSSSSFAVTVTGKLYAWGNNAAGQLGNSIFENSAIPLDISQKGALAGKTITSVSSGNKHTLALASDGAVYAWGDGSSGQLGNGKFSSSVVPVQVPGISGITAISAGESHSLALKSDGTVYAWGEGSYGRLGNGDFTSSNVPVQVINLSDIKAISAGRLHSLALKSDGTVYAWGNGYEGQLGNTWYVSAPFGSAVPVKADISGVTAISAGSQHSLALKNDGTVYAWGNGSTGQLGDSFYIFNSPHSTARPVQIKYLFRVTAIAAGALHSLALRADSLVFAWGGGVAGQLGNGAIYKNAPYFGSTSVVQVTNLVDVTAIAAGGGHNLALKSDGNIFAWGAGMVGQLGNGIFYNFEPYASPVRVQVLGLNLHLNIQQPPPLPVFCTSVAVADTIPIENTSSPQTFTLQDLLANDAAERELASFTQPSSGTLAYNSNQKRFTYTPAPGVTDKATFTYTLQEDSRLGNPLLLDGRPHYYELVRLPKEIFWEQAQAIAQSRNYNGQQGYLATITSETENSHIRQIIRNNGWRSYSWLGGSDAMQEGTWRWTTGPEAGKMMNYSNWVAGEPNNIGEEDYLVMSWDHGRWNDLSGVATGRIGVKSFVVEYGSSSDCAPALTAIVTLNLSAEPNATLNTSKAESDQEAGLKVVQKESLEIYPNPVRERATIEIGLPATGSYSLDLYDMRGAKVKTIRQGQAPAKPSLTVELDVAPYPKGVYLLRLETEQGVLSKRLIIER
jgi:alpha-tubulin suppressor-like RCC1 family protein